MDQTDTQPQGTRGTQQVLTNRYAVSLALIACLSMLGAILAVQAMDGIARSAALVVSTVTLCLLLFQAIFIFGPLRRMLKPEADIRTQAQDREPAAPARAASAPEKALSLGTRILIVEDNPINQKITAALLASQGYHFDIAANGKEGVAMAETGEYGLVLMDIQMPVMDGLEATRRIRELSSDVAHIPIVAVTANAMRGDKETYITAGMNDFVSKPVDAAGLISVVSQFVPKPPVADAPQQADDTEPAPLQAGA